MTRPAVFAAAMLGVFAAPGADAHPVAGPACAGLLSTADAPASLSAETLIGLRDLGYPAPIASALSIAASPDGRVLAFPIQRADLASGGYCSGVVILDLATRASHVVGSSAELAMRGASYRGPVVPKASPAFVTPAWSPDGAWLAFLRSQDGVTALWRVRRDGSELSLIPNSAADIDAYRWTADGTGLVVAIHSEPAAVTAARDREALGGYLYDDRFLPFAAAHPFAMDPGRAVVVLDAVTGATRVATEAERRDIAPAAASDPDASPQASTRKAWLAPEHADRVDVPDILHVSDHARVVPCAADLCRDVTNFWWSATGEDLVFLRRDGWARERTGLYQWHVGHGQPRLVWSTNDLLVGCARVAAHLYCATESATLPRHIIGIDLATGRRATVFDPNPEFAHGTLQPAERLHWSTDLGTPVIGDLVLPVGYRPGQRYPLIVVTYQTRGFLRGGTGDEYPIQLFAARGFVVLSLQRPADLGADMPEIRTVKDQERFETEGWRDRANVQSAVRNGIRLLTERHLVDPARVGLTGLSDGSEIVTYGIIHDPSIAAAAISNCCNEPESFLAVGGPVTARYFHALGYPRLTDHDAGFWKPASLSYNADTVKTPLLMQLPDAEFPISLQSLQALREAAAPVEAYVFPGEGHVKLDPRHRLSIYRRNLAWFDFWLRDHQDPDLASPDDYRRWTGMKAARRAAIASPAPAQ